MKIIQVEGAQLPRALQDVDFAGISTTYVMSSGMDLHKAIFCEPNFTFINWVAARESDIGSSWLKDVESAYNSDEFKSYVQNTMKDINSLHIGKMIEQNNNNLNK